MTTHVPCEAIDNPRVAHQNRRLFDRLGLVCATVSGPIGSGKTSIIEAILPRLSGELHVGVVAAGYAEPVGSDRLRQPGVSVARVFLEDRCHLGADQVHRGIRELPLHDLDLLLIENAGTLQCQASTDLGEHLRVAVFSVSGGADLPAKCPRLFRQANLVLLTKHDLLPHVTFDEQAATEHVRRLNPCAEVVCTDARRGGGVHRAAGWMLGYVRALGGRAGSRHAHPVLARPQS